MIGYRLGNTFDDDPRHRKPSGRRFVSSRIFRGWDSPRTFHAKLGLSVVPPNLTRQWQVSIFLWSGATHLTTTCDKPPPHIHTYIEHMYPVCMHANDVFLSSSFVEDLDDNQPNLPESRALDTVSCNLCFVFTWRRSRLSDTISSFLLHHEILVCGSGRRCRCVARDRVHRCLCSSSILRSKRPSSSFYGECDCRDSDQTNCRYEAWNVWTPKESGGMARSGRSQQVLR